jgi:hypothetical protein
MIMLLLVFFILGFAFQHFFVFYFAPTIGIAAPHIDADEKPTIGSPSTAIRTPQVNPFLAPSQPARCTPELPGSM